MSTSALSESDRSAILEAEIQRYIVQGYRLTARTTTTAQLIRPKTFDVGTAILWTLLLLVGLVIYLLMYAARQDEAVYLTVDEQGTIQRIGKQPAPAVAVNDGKWECPTCQCRTDALYFECMRCGAQRPANP